MIERREERGERKEECEIRSCKDGCNSCFFCILAFFYPMVSNEVKKKP